VVNLPKNPGDGVESAEFRHAWNVIARWLLQHNIGGFLENCQLPIVRNRTCRRTGEILEWRFDVGLVGIAEHSLARRSSVSAWNQLTAIRQPGQPNDFLRTTNDETEKNRLPKSLLALRLLGFAPFDYSKFAGSFAVHLAACQLQERGKR
jgi:hypothetical protein